MFLCVEMDFRVFIFSLILDEIPELECFKDGA